MALIGTKVPIGSKFRFYYGCLYLEGKSVFCEYFSSTPKKASGYYQKVRFYLHLNHDLSPLQIPLKIFASLRKDAHEKVRIRS